MSASIWWRYSESASSAPAMKAPSAAEKSRRLHHQRHADDGEERARRHRLAHAGRGDDAVEPAQQEAPGDDDPEDRADGDQRLADVHARLLRAKGEERHERDERDRGKVLEQQHREGEPAMPRRKLALLLQHLQREGGRGEREREPDEERLRRGQTKRDADCGKNRGGHGKLRRAQPEDRRAHGPQPDRTKLEPDHEQQHHHAELAEMEEFPHIVEGIEGAEHVRPDDDAGGEIAEHRAHAQGAAERRGDGSCGQKHRDLNQLCRFHDESLANAVLGSTQTANPLAGSDASADSLPLRERAPARQRSAANGGQALSASPSL